MIGLIPTKTDSLIRPKSMLLAKAEGNHVPDLAEANVPVVGLEVRATANRAREVLVAGSVLVVKRVPGPVAVLVGKAA